MTREEKERTGKYVLQMARLLEDGCYQQEMLLKAVHIIDEALEQEPMEKFKSVKDHIFKLAGDYKCWDNRLTDDEALELCHILEQEPRKCMVAEILLTEEKVSTDMAINVLNAIGGISIAVSKEQE